MFLKDVEHHYTKRDACVSKKGGKCTDLLRMSTHVQKHFIENPGEQIMALASVLQVRVKTS